MQQGTWYLHFLMLSFPDPDTSGPKRVCPMLSGSLKYSQVVLLEEPFDAKTVCLVRCYGRYDQTIQRQNY